MKEEELQSVTVFTTGNNALLEVAKNLLSGNQIKFTTSLTGYNTEISIAKKDEDAATDLLSELVSNQYIPTNDSDLKIQSFIGKWGLAFLIMFVIIMITIFLLLK